MSDPRCPRLIEVAFPIREVSAESVRDKSIRHGHLSTLHLWWARRPLPACRAIVFASVVPDPDDPRCPEAFRETVARKLRDEVPPILRSYSRGREVRKDPDPYRPYDGLEDTLRDRLLTFISKWSPEALAFEEGKRAKPPKTRHLLDDRSLVKWETTDPTNEQGRVVLEIARELVRAAWDDRSPVVLDPFAGGGAIPLEAARLGCRAVANDYNPVAALILKASCELPQKYGKPASRVSQRERLPGMDEEEERIPNVLAHDVEYWAHRIMEMAEGRIGHLYPSGKDGLPVVGWYWARTAPCANPSCRGEMPLLKTLSLCTKKGKKVALQMEVDQDAKEVRFGIVRGEKIQETEGTMLRRGNVRCPFCGEVTPREALVEAGARGNSGERMVAVIVDGEDGKGYRAVEDQDLEAFHLVEEFPVERPGEQILPEVTSGEDVANSSGIRVHQYGMTVWGDLFNPRQLLAMQTFVSALRELTPEIREMAREEGYAQAVLIYLGLWISRNSMRMTTIGRWDSGEEMFQTPFDGARLPMKWDYPEANPFSEVSGGFANQLDWILRYLERESFESEDARVLRGDGARLPLEDGCCDAVVTDPPYFDEAAYADLSDFFYVWLKRAIGDVVPEILATPQAPKTDEATALKHRFGGDADRANRHFTTKLGQVFAEARRVNRADGIESIVFAHQENEAWSALVHSLFEADLSIDATWPVEMELKNRMRGINSAALETSITVVCRPREAGSAAAFRDIRKEIEETVRKSVRRFWKQGFRGADLIVACYGPAVGVFGRYERVERADGRPVEVPELLDLARRSALEAIAGEFQGDPLSTLYYVWASLYGTSEQAWDDARLVVQMGGDAEGAMDLARSKGIFVVDGSRCRLATLQDRATTANLGKDPDGPLIDALHRAMHLWKQEHRQDLVRYLAEHDLFDEEPFWNLAQALFAVLPRNSEDWRLTSALITERPTLRREGRHLGEPTTMSLFDQ